jgi:hypothetical protein
MRLPYRRTAGQPRGSLVRWTRRLGESIVAAIGRPASAELLDVLTRPEPDRAALIGRLSVRNDAAWLAEPLTEIESHPDDITRLRLTHSPREALSGD